MTAPLAAIVLAAGFGTRLRPLTDLRPKALCPVANVPLIDLALARVRALVPSAGGTAGTAAVDPAGPAETVDIAVNVHAGREQLEAHLEGRGVHISVEEDAPLGTAGAVARLRPWIAGRPVAVVNADAWCDFGLGPLLDGWDGDRVRLLVADEPAGGDFGRWRFAGASVLPWAAVEALPDDPAGLYEVCWRPGLASGTVELHPVNGRFVDCGTPSDYLAANLAASGGTSVIGPGARVDGEVVRSVVWPGAVVRRGERLVESIRAGDSLTVPAPQRAASPTA